MSKTIPIFVQLFEHTKKHDQTASYTLVVDEDVLPQVQYSTFRLSADGNHLIAPIRNARGDRVYGKLPEYLYGSGVTAPKGRKGNPAPNDFRKSSRNWSRIDKKQIGRIGSQLEFK